MSFIKEWKTWWLFKIQYYMFISSITIYWRKSEFSLMSAVLTSMIGPLQSREWKENIINLKKLVIQWLFYFFFNFPSLFWSNRPHTCYVFIFYTYLTLQTNGLDVEYISISYLKYLTKAINNNSCYLRLLCTLYIKATLSLTQ